MEPYTDPVSPDPAERGTTPHTVVDFPFAPLPEALIYDGDVTHAAVRVYAALMRHGMTADSCYPSHARLGKLVGMSYRSVARPLDELEELGWITRRERFTERGSRTSDGYTLHTERRVPERAPHVAERSGPAHTNADPPTLQNGGKESSLNENHLNEEPSPPSALERLGEFPIALSEQKQFSDFWDIYPRKTGKRPAMVKFMACLKRPGVTAQDILEGARRYAADPNLPEENFIRHPTTWLNQEGWNDPPLPPRGGNRAQNRDAANLEAARQFLGAGPDPYGEIGR